MSARADSSIDDLEEFVDNLILQNDYPGFEPRSFRVGLPENFLQAGAKLFSQALGHPNVYVRLCALRIFQDKPGTIKPHLNAIAGLLDHQDPWVRKEAAITLERFPTPDLAMGAKIASQMTDEDVMVRREAAKALGKILSKSKDTGANAAQDKSTIVAALESVMHADADAQVWQKAEKALRKAGYFKG